MTNIVVIKSIILFLVISKNVAETNPPFHAMSFGSHATSIGIGEVTSDNMISPELFTLDHLIPRNPLILRDVAKQWPGFTEWTDGYLKKYYGDLEVRVDKRKDKFTDMPAQGDVCLGRDTLGHFVDTYKAEDANKFVESQLPVPLYKFVKIPPPLGCGDLWNSFVEVDMWMSSGEVQSMLRKNALNAITCVINGTKEWKVVEPKYNGYMYEIWRGDTHEKGNTAYSLVNSEKVDMIKYPQVAKIPKVLTGSLDAGDCLYVPAGNWHTVNSKGDKNMAVTFVFKDIKDRYELNLIECASKPNALPLEEVDPDWNYFGNGRMSMGNSPISFYVDMMESSFFGSISKILKYENIYNTLLFLTAYLPYNEHLSADRAKKLYDELSSYANDGEDYTADMLPYLTRGKLRVLINQYIQPPVHANDYDHEYKYFSPDQISELFKKLSNEDRGIIRKDHFIAKYVSMGGHVGIANSMWKKFAGKETEVVFNLYEKRIGNKVLGKFYDNYMEEGEFDTIYTSDDDFSEPEEIIESTPSTEDGLYDTPGHKEKDEL